MEEQLSFDECDDDAPLPVPVPPEHHVADTPNDIFELKRRAPYRAIKNVRTGDVL